MKTYRIGRVRRAAMLATMSGALAFQFGGCNLGEFTTTTTTTLSGREVISFLVRTAVLTPIETLINNGIEAFFDRFEDDEG